MGGAGAVLPRDPSTAQRLAKILYIRGLREMSAKAKAGYYDDFRSPLATPIVQLVVDLTKMGHYDLAERARQGEFDATKEEASEWYEREGRKLLGDVFRK